MGQIVKAIEGMAEACRVLDFPVVSGNVSLYNETDGVGIPPTPVVGGVGLIEDVSKIATLKGAQPGDTLILIGETKGHLGASLYAREILGLKGEDLGPPPPVDLEMEKRNADFVRSLIEQGLVNAVHDVSDGGIACAAAEMALASNLGFVIDPTVQEGLNNLTWLFGEDSGRCLITVPNDSEGQLLADMIAKMAGADIEFSVVGQFVLERELTHTVLGLYADFPLSKLRQAHEGWLPGYMNDIG